MVGTTLVNMCIVVGIVNFLFVVTAPHIVGDWNPRFRKAAASKSRQHDDSGIFGIR